MKKPIRFSNSVSTIFGASAIILIILLMLIQSRMWIGSAGPEIQEKVVSLIAPDALIHTPVKNMSRPPAVYFKYGRVFIAAYLLLITAILTAKLPFKWRLKKAVIITLTIAAAANIFNYWIGEYLTIYAREIFFTYIELPSICVSIFIILLFFFGNKHVVEGSKADSQNAKNWITPTASITAITIMFFLCASIRYKPNVVIGKTGPEVILNLPKHTGIKVFILNTGFNRMSKALSPGNPKWRPAPVFLIQHPKYGYLLFDSGIAKKVALEGQGAMPFPMPLLFESMSSEDKVIDAQLTRFGVPMDSIKTIIISHLHGDHTGGLQLFRKTRGVVHTNSTVKTNGLTLVNASAFQKHSSVISNTFDLFGDETLLLIESAGHTTGDLMLLVSADNGPALLTGDAVVHFDWLNSNDVESLPENPSGAAKVRNTLRQLLKTNKNLLLFPGHDLPEIPAERDDIVKLFPENFTENLN